MGIESCLGGGNVLENENEANESNGVGTGWATGRGMEGGLPSDVNILTSISYLKYNKVMLIT